MLFFTSIFSFIYLSQICLSSYPQLPGPKLAWWISGEKQRAHAWEWVFRLGYCRVLWTPYHHLQTLRVFTGKQEEKNRILARVLKKYTARSGRLHCHSDKEPCAYVYIHATHTHTHEHARSRCEPQMGKSSSKLSSYSYLALSKWENEMIVRGRRRESESGLSSITVRPESGEVLPLASTSLNWT